MNYFLPVFLLLALFATSCVNETSKTKEIKLSPLTEKVAEPEIGPVSETPEAVQIPTESQPESSNQGIKLNTEGYENLLFNTKLSISPQQTNWVLFTHGTYIIFPKGTRREDMRRSALGILKRYNDETLMISKSQLVKGWVAGSANGVYNYISLQQAGSRMASDSILEAIGKTNITKDQKSPIILHINPED